MPRILIVDDVYTIRLKTELVLRQAGSYTVQSVSSGAEAIEAVRTNPPDAIILDIVMAGLDGFGTLRALRAQGIQCPVIAYTARRERKRGEFQTRGFDAYVPKTENLSNLLAVLRIVLNSANRSGQSPPGSGSPTPPINRDILAPTMLHLVVHSILRLLWSSD